jgi:hypothetical protein
MGTDCGHVFHTAAGSDIGILKKRKFSSPAQYIIEFSSEKISFHHKPSSKVIFK